MEENMARKEKSYGLKQMYSYFSVNNDNAIALKYSYIDSSTSAVW
jgi:hypothetical protein